MANYFPLIVETGVSNTINQLPAGDFLDLSESGIANSGNITMHSSGTINAGNILPLGNVTYNLGSPTLMWGNGYFGGNTIYLGSLQLKDIGGNTFAVYTADGSTQANIDVGSIDVSGITQGTSTIGIAGINGNAYFTVSGTSNVLVVAPAGLYTSGTVSASGNVTGGNLNAVGLSLSGNVVSAIISTSNITTTANVSGGNIITSGLVSATGNISTSANLNATSAFVNAGAVLASGRVEAGTSMSAAGNITGANINTGGLVSATGNITGGNLNATGLSLSGNVVSNLNVDGNIAAPNVSVTSMTNGQLAIASTNGLLVGGPDLLWEFGNARLFTTGLDSNGAITTSGTISATGNITGGNINTTGLSLSGNVVSTLNSTSEITTTANITGGNLNAVGLSLSGNVVSAINSTSAITTTANITGGNLNAVGLSLSGNVVSALNSTSEITTTANITAGNIIGTLVGGDITGTSLSVTGNVTGGNLNAVGLSLSGNVLSAVNTTSNITTTATIKGANLSATGAIVSTGNLTVNQAVTLAGSTYNIAIGSLQTTGNIIMGGLGQTGSITVGRSSSPYQVYIGTGNTQAGNTKTVTIGEGGYTGSTTTISIGPALGTGTTTFNSGGTVAIANTSSTALSVAGNIIGGNVNSAGLASITGNVIGGNINTGGLVSATGNINGGNINSDGNIVALNDISGNAQLYVGPGANATSLVSPVIVAQKAGTAYVQVAVKNTAGTGSADYVAYGNNGDDSGAWTDFGFTGNAFADASYTITGAGDGYFFVLGNTSVGGGNLVIATGGQGTTNDIVFATNGFAAANEKMRFIDATGQFYIETTTAATSTSTGALRVDGGVGVAGDIYGGGILTVTGNVTGGNITSNGYLMVDKGMQTDGAYDGPNADGLVVDYIHPYARLSVNSGDGFKFYTDGLGNVLLVTIDQTGNLTAVGNVSGGNILTGGLISATGNITSSGNIAGGNIISNHIYGTDITINATGNLTLDTAGNINASNNFINNLATPLQGKDAATKAYVDSVVSTGIHIHPPVLVEVQSPLTAVYAQGGTTPTWTTIATGNTISTGSAHNLSVNDIIVFGSTTNGITAGTAYVVFSVPSSTSITITDEWGGAEITTLVNGTGLSITSRANSGVGATLTNSGTQTALVVDGVAVSVNNRVLVNNQTNAAWNGVYVVTVVGDGSTNWVMTRSADEDFYNPSNVNGMSAGDYFFVQSGNTAAGESYVLTTEGILIIGTTLITFTQFGSSAVYSAGTGISFTGTTINIANTAVTPGSYGSSSSIPTFTVNQQGQLTAAGSASITAPAGALTGTTLNSTVVNSSLTSVGTLNTLSVTGSITGGNLLYGAGQVSGTGNVNGGNINSAAVVSAVGNVDGGNINTVGLVSATGNITGGNLSAGTGNVVGGNLTITSLVNAGTISAAANIIGGNILFNNNFISGSGNITGGNIIGTIVGGAITGTSLSVTGNVTGGNLNAAGLSLSSNVVSALNVSGNIAGSNITTPGLISATGNITGGNLNAAGLSLSSNVVSALNSTSAITTTANITGGNILTSGLVSSAGNIIGSKALIGVSSTTLTNPVAVFSGAGVSYDQVAIINTVGTGSADLAIYANNGDETQSWIDVGFTGNTFNDTNYTITGAGDGYLFSQGNAATGGNLVVATGNTGTTRDVVFSFGFLAANEFLRFQRSTNTVLPKSNVTANLGSATNYFNNAYVNTLTTAGNITAGNLNAAGLSLSSNVVSALNSTSAITTTANITGGNLSVGTGTITVGNIVNGTSNGVGNIGSSTTYFNTAFIKATSAQYADLAEAYAADGGYAPGTVLSFGGSNEVTISNIVGDSRIAGVVSTNPAHVMNSAIVAENVAILALTGRVPTFVSGVVEKGDMMISAGNGRAIACATPTIGTVIGKALENHAGGDGVIEIVVGRI